MVAPGLAQQEIGEEKDGHGAGHGDEHLAGEGHADEDAVVDEGHEAEKGYGNGPCQIVGCNSLHALLFGEEAENELAGEEVDYAAK